MKWTAHQLQDLLWCARLFKYKHLEKLDVDLPLIQIELEAHRKALRMVLAEGLSLKQHKSLLMSLVQKGAKHSSYTNRTIEEAMRYVDSAPTVIHSTLIPNYLKGKLELDVPYQIKIDDYVVEDTVDIVCGRQPVQIMMLPYSLGSTTSLRRGLAGGFSLTAGVDCVTYYLSGKAAQVRYSQGKKTGVMKRHINSTRDALNQIRSGAFGRCSPDWAGCGKQICPYYIKCLRGR